MPLADLVPYERNSKKHPPEQVEQIAASIREFGDCDPIAVWHDADGRPVIVEGHGRLLALKLLGEDAAPVISLDHLTDDQRRAYSHVHNQTTLSSGIDEDVLALDMDELAFDWEEFGFEVTEPGDGREDGEPVDVPAVVPQETISKRGDIWQLGVHRVMCGDSTDPADVSRLMDGARADIHFGSPPYALAKFGDGTLRTDLGQGEAYSEFHEVYGDDYQALLDSALENAMEHCDDVMFVLGLTQGDKRQIAKMLHEHSDRLCDVIVWDKGQGMTQGLPSQRACIGHACEFIFCFNRDGSRAFSHPQWEIATQDNVVRVGKNSQNEYSAIHHATFNVDLPYQMLRDYTEASVLDLFGGTGTTLIAAEQLGRIAYLMEIDPLYVDVIVDRWERLTGGKAKRIDGSYH